MYYTDKTCLEIKPVQIFMKYSITAKDSIKTSK